VIEDQPITLVEVWRHKTQVIDRPTIEVSAIALCTATVYGGALK